MNVKSAVQRRTRSPRHGDVNLTAVMNIFLILIPFLLLTASFVRLAVLEMTLPNLEKSASGNAPEKAVLNILLIRESGFQLKSPELKFPELPKSDDYDWSALRRQLAAVKERHPSVDDMIIAPEGTIRYEIIIAVMDACRESGFPNISISG